MNELLNQLNPPQREAVLTTEGPLLVLAGAGSGKTRVLTYRIAHMIEECNVAPWNILAITFTNKAAKEMAQRVEALIGSAANDMWVRTFHSACVRILRRDIDRLGYNKSFNIIDSDDQKSLVKECMKELGISEDEFPAKTVINEISSAKDKLLLPDEYIKEFGTEFRLAKIGKIYKLYQSKLKNASDLDFDDLIMLTVKLFEAEPEILAYYQNKFKYILVDEYQDTNVAQNELIIMLAKEHRNICVVGDDDQSIYRFRGADITNILEFENSFPNVKTIRLEQNYRSTQNILSAANSVIKNNAGRKSKSLWTDSGDGEKINVYRATGDFDEADYILKTVNSLVEEGYKYGDIAILFRAKASSKLIEDSFMRAAVPYRVLSGLRFYDRKEIRDMIAYLRLIKNPDDDISLRRIINVPSRKIGKVTLDAIASVSSRENVSMYKAMGEHLAELKGGVTDFYNVIEGLREKAAALPIDELVAAVYNESGYAQYLEKENASERIENVGELISGAKHYMETVLEPNFDDYMDNLVLVSDIDNYDEDMDAVVMMTMHAAKGLEFPIVFICGFDDGVFPSVKAIYDPDEIEEERRLCYVAITRARQRLYMTGSHSRMVFGKTSTYRPSRFLKEIPEELYLMTDAREELMAKREKLREQLPKTVGPRNRDYVPKVTVTAETKMAPKGDLTFKAGDEVSHVKFGRGVVISAQPVGNDVHYKINFEGVGEKNLMGLYAKLTKLN